MPLLRPPPPPRPRASTPRITPVGTQSRTMSSALPSQTLPRALTVANNGSKNGEKISKKSCSTNSSCSHVLIYTPGGVTQKGRLVPMYRDFVECHKFLPPSCPAFELSVSPSVDGVHTCREKREPLLVRCCPFVRPCTADASCVAFSSRQAMVLVEKKPRRPPPPPTTTATRTTPKSCCTR